MSTHARGPIVLTRYLYEAHEVELSLLHAVLRRGCLDEALFWATELLESGLSDRLWFLLWRTYYDFFTAIHPLLERELVTMHTAYLETEAVEPCATAVANLAAREPDPRVFELRMWLATGDAPEPLTPAEAGSALPNGLDPEFAGLSLAVLAGNLTLIATLLRTLPAAAAEDAEMALIQSWSLVYGVDPPAPTPSNPYYCDWWHALLAIVVSMETPDDKVALKCLLVHPGTSVRAPWLVASTASSADSSHLPLGRRYPVSPLIGAFALPRHAVVRAPFAEHLWFHWMRYAARCPLWRQRMLDCGATVAGGEVTLDGDAEETFAARWDVVPDEQTMETQYVASAPIAPLRYDSWFDGMFGRRPRHAAQTLPLYA
jgi:hypothetical protein